MTLGELLEAIELHKSAGNITDDFELVALDFINPTGRKVVSISIDEGELLLALE